MKCKFCSNKLSYCDSGNLICYNHEDVLVIFNLDNHYDEVFLICFCKKGVEIQISIKTKTLEAITPVLAFYPKSGPKKTKYYYRGYDYSFSTEEIELSNDVKFSFTNENMNSEMDRFIKLIPFL